MKPCVVFVALLGGFDETRCDLTGRSETALPDTRTHRGPDPRDSPAFDPPAWPALRAAVSDLSWLLERQYAPMSSLKLVGDRYALTDRQRMAVMRSSCSDTALGRRREHQQSAAALAGQAIVIDGFNLLTTIEAALGGGVILSGRDGVYRDLAGVHGTYRKVAETLPALRLVGAVLAALGVARTRWLLDRPVSNSGRLKTIILEMAQEQGWDWEAELAFNPDALLGTSPDLVATADSAILDRGPRWFNLARYAIERHVPSARVVNLEVRDS
jgi:hypothetical protein